MSALDLLDSAKRAKIECLASGVKITEQAMQALAIARSGRPVSIYEYPTTDGIIFKLDGAGYVNASYAKRLSGRPAFEITHDGGGFSLRRIETGEKHPIEMVPLPGFVGADGSRPFGRILMTHTDRARLEPLVGCSYGCAFCDLRFESYKIFDPDTLLKALKTAIDDPILPARHGMIGGGTPRTEDRHRLDSVYRAVLVASPVPMDVMVAPRPRDEGFIDRLYHWGANDFFINIELFGDAKKKIVPQKAKNFSAYESAIEAAVELTGGKGRVNSMLVIGIEPLEDTLKGVEWLAEKGCYPVLSPFRPAPGTSLARHSCPSAEFLAEAWVKSKEIAVRYGVEVGSRCAGCQHNEVSFPHKNMSFC